MVVTSDGTFCDDNGWMDGQKNVWVIEFVNQLNRSIYTPVKTSVAEAFWLVTRVADATALEAGLHSNTESGADKFCSVDEDIRFWLIMEALQCCINNSWPMNSSQSRFCIVASGCTVVYILSVW
jgi:hypothetical protein